MFVLYLCCCTFYLYIIHCYYYGFLIEFKGSYLVGKQPSSNEAQHSHENTNIDSSNFQTQGIE